MIFHKSLGAGQPVIIIHGLFGTADNWRTVARQLSERYHVITVDLRNHGRSFWSEEFCYEDAAQDVIDLMDELGLDQATLLGHSMGGKVALTLAHLHPDRVDRFVVVDITPRDYPRGHDEIFEAIFAVTPEELDSRSEAEEILGRYIPERSVVQFLMKSLARRPEGGFRWKTNFRGLYQSYEHILSAVPISDIEAPMLLIRGTRSRYIQDADIISVQEQIPDVRAVDIEAGHWVHAEQPQALISAVDAFLTGV